MPNAFDENDLTRLLLSSDQQPSGAYDHLGWATFSGDQSGDPLVQLTTLHESFHSELNNLTVYGFLLQGFAFMVMAGQGAFDRDKFLELVERCRVPHEVYATFVSTTVLSESFHRKKLEPPDFLAAYPEYQTYFKLGVALSSDFQGNYLKELAVTALVIACFQSRAIYEAAIADLSAFYPGMVRSAEFPDRRMDFLAKNLPAGFLADAFEQFCQSESDDRIVAIMRQTEVRPAAYEAAIAPETDDFQNRLLAYWVDALAGFLDKNGLPTFRLPENLPLLEVVFERVNALAGADPDKMKLVLNTEPMDIPKNVLLNFMNEKYTIREERWKAVIVPMSRVDPSYWPQLSSSGEENEHFFWVTRVGRRLEIQYEWADDDQAWLAERRDKPMLFLRRRGFNPRTERFEVELYHIESQDQWRRFLEATNDKKHVSNISMHTLALPGWEEGWYLLLAGNTQCSILFDLPPYQQIESFFEPNYSRVGLNLIWMNDAQYRHCALVFQGTERAEPDDLSPLFVLLASEITCRVVYNYLLRERPTGQFVVDESFVQANSWLINIVLSHLFNEERIFDFNII
ncbi:MAG: hypothetical protein H6569_15695 [Lewinellaceae bacterium]|nr:hypothetical protein [Lewinellaceae bacterium]